MPSSALTSEIKVLLVAELNLTGKDPQTILDDAPFFGERGLGLDSLDAVLIAMLVEERFGVRVPEGVNHARGVVQHGHDEASSAGGNSHCGAPGGAM